MLKNARKSLDRFSDNFHTFMNFGPFSFHLSYRTISHNIARAADITAQSLLHCVEMKGMMNIDLE